MFELATIDALRVNVAELFHFECTFHRGRIVIASAQDNK